MFTIRYLMAERSPLAQYRAPPQPLDAFHISVTVQLDTALNNLRQAVVSEKIF
jgi:hypothetical protein